MVIMMLCSLNCLLSILYYSEVIELEWMSSLQYAIELLRLDIKYLVFYFFISKANDLIDKNKKSLMTNSIRAAVGLVNFTLLVCFLSSIIIGFVEPSPAL